MPAVTTCSTPSIRSKRTVGFAFETVTNRRAFFRNFVHEGFLFRKRHDLPFDSRPLFRSSFVYQPNMRNGNAITFAAPMTTTTPMRSDIVITFQ